MVKLRRVIVFGRCRVYSSSKWLSDCVFTCSVPSLVFVCVSRVGATKRQITEAFHKMFVEWLAVFTANVPTRWNGENDESNIFASSGAFLFVFHTRGVMHSYHLYFWMSLFHKNISIWIYTGSGQGFYCKLLKSSTLPVGLKCLW